MLLKFQEQIQYYAETISAITGLEVEVVDTELIRIAGTGDYSQNIGKSIKSAGNLLKNTLKGSTPLFIENPRQNKICKGCQTKANCRELCSVCAPISDGVTTYGAMEMICFSSDARAQMLERREIYMNFLSLLSSSIAVRVRERQELQDITDLLNIMSQVVNTNEKGILIYDAKGKVAYKNDQAEEILSKTIPSQFENFSVTPTGFTLSDLNEYTVEQEGRQQMIVGKQAEIDSTNSRFSSVLVFDTIRSVVSKSLQAATVTFDSSLDNIIGQSPHILQLKEQITATGDTNSSVLISGESGTGKELVARAIHSIGDRSEEPFVAINCGAIPDTLLESELFGYVGGAFTGALRQGQIGKFELADGGVLFLDEISCMPLYLQVKLLRVLQERKITRLGGNRPISVDIRVIAASNDNLHELMAQNMFRDDLYYRLNVIPIQTTPLRERLDDLDLLVNHFISKYCDLFGKNKIKLQSSIVQRMRNYDWPGNIRELENAIEYLVNMATPEGIINEAGLHNGFLQSKDDFRQEQVQISQGPECPIVSLKELEQQAILRAIEYYGDTTSGKKKAAKSLGIGLATLYRKLGD
ncbi:sigma-54-dependent Fis family transcriptional regulator [Desulfovibrio sp. JC022]|uniref:sigma-54 interaction domain-containing protein n=1 Tax=Desulfovibrio sp. JC022 TaxID=2593642 RepID=UPI0013D603CD|nr:sigma 54-interacting transcriptional regulator [Desulfovibrio sp. JC022]NDV23328.1 AAA family ATPase [Desulfovibrio sp. JC022]